MMVCRNEAVGQGMGVVDAFCERNSDLSQLCREHVHNLVECIGNVKRSASKVDDNV